MHWQPHLLSVLSAVVAGRRNRLTDLRAVTSQLRATADRVLSGAAVSQQLAGLGSPIIGGEGG
jgi:hypothetical protein